MKTRILVIDDVHPRLFERLEAHGKEVVYAPQSTRKEVLGMIADFEGLVVRSKTKIDKELISKATRLKFVARAGAGVDNLDVDNLNEKNIQILNAPEGNRDAVGEHALGMLLAVMHKLQVSNDQVKNQIWDREGNRGIELKGKVVGILGVGHMGHTFARKLSGLGCEILGYDKYKVGYEDQSVKECTEFKSFASQVEILSIHVPLTEETHQLVDYEFLRYFPKLQILLNTSRGEVLKTHDLIRIIQEGTLYGAALDVLENERLESLTDDQKKWFQALTDHPNIVLSPHVAGWTFESYFKISEVLADKILDLDK